MVENDRLRIDELFAHHSRWFWTFLFLAGSLAATILLKIGEVQYLELIFASELVVLIGLFVQNGLKTRVLRPSIVLGAMYLLFVSLGLALSVLALSRDFFIPDGLSLLKQPVWITVSRSVELAIDVGAMLYLAQQFFGDRVALLFTMNTYFWAGMASVLYSFISYPLNVLAGAQLGTFNIDHRMRGFFNEGGPYGLYVLSVFLVGVALYRIGAPGRLYIRISLFMLPIALVGSRSKAGAIAMTILLVLNLLLIRGTARRLIVLGVLVVAAIAVGSSLDLPAQLRAYRRAASFYERTSGVKSGDPNFIYGRIAGAFIVPRMLAAHPLAGIGWGNYGLVRNDPEYRGASAWARLYDDPSIGLAGTAAELGLPLTLLLLFCLLFPFLYLRRRQAPLYLQNLALVQPVVTLCGTHLNLTYPWVVTAFALALGCLHRPAPVPSSRLLRAES